MLIDLLLLLAIVGYAVSGYRQGLVVAALSLGGFLVGAVAAITVVPALAQTIQPGVGRVLLVLAAVLLAAWLGQLLGALLGGKVRDQMRARSTRTFDQVAGSVAGVLSVLMVTWFLAGAIRGSPAPMISRAVGSSRIIAGVDAVMPDALSSLAERLRAAVAGGSFPRVFSGVGAEEILPVAPPDPTTIPPAALAKARRSIVKITGDAPSCNRGQEGSGSVIGPHRVITNAHVVAGVRAPRVQVAGTGRTYRASVVVFDARRDLAVLDVPGLTAPALPIGQDLSRSDPAAVAGFPQNGPFRAVPARVRSVLHATGEDIYGHAGVTRLVYSLYAVVQPGNSGGPVLDPSGALVGVVFAKSLDDPRTGYALTMTEAAPVISASRHAVKPVSTGGCSVG